MTTELKTCEKCGKEFKKKKNESYKQFEKKKFCSNKCKGDLHSEFMKTMKKEKNSNWKGDNATNLTTFHKRVENELGKPNKCEICGRTDKDTVYDWGNLTGNYNDINDYKRMCRSCHKKYDLARLGKGLITLKELPLSERDKKIVSSIAIKWVKDELRKIDEGEDETSLMSGFMQFFNLSEEDLT